MRTTAKEAQKQNIFVLNYDNANYNDSSSLENKISVEETNYLDWVYLSIDETTSPNGIAARQFIKEREDITIKVTKFKHASDIGTFKAELIDGYVKGNTWRFESFLKWLPETDLKENFTKLSNDEVLNNGWEVEDENDTFEYYTNGIIYEIMNWGVGGNNLRSEEVFFLSQEEAENYLFEQVENDFYSDDQRDTQYFSTQEESEERRIEILSEWWGVSEETTKSLIKWQEKVDEIKAKKQAIRFKKQRDEAERIERTAIIYAEIIEKVEGESFDETVKRLAAAIGQRIEKQVFYKAVKIVRRK